MIDGAIHLLSCDVLYCFARSQLVDKNFVGKDKSVITSCLLHAYPPLHYTPSDPESIRLHSIQIQIWCISYFLNPSYARFEVYSNMSNNHPHKNPTRWLFFSKDYPSLHQSLRDLLAMTGVVRSPSMQQNNTVFFFYVERGCLRMMATSEQLTKKINMRKRMKKFWK